MCLITTDTALNEEMSQEGYEPGVRRNPSSLVDGLTIDYDACRNSPPDGRSYRAFAVCPVCGCAEEF